MGQQIGHLVPLHLFLEGGERGVMGDEQQLHASDLGEIFQVFDRQRLAEAAMMGSACQNPGRGGGLQIGLRSPYRSGAQ